MSSPGRTHLCMCYAFKIYYLVRIKTLLLYFYILVEKIIFVTYEFLDIEFGLDLMVFKRSNLKMMLGKEYSWVMFHILIVLLCTMTVIQKWLRLLPIVNLMKVLMIYSQNLFHLVSNN